MTNQTSNPRPEQLNDPEGQRLVQAIHARKELQGTLANTICNASNYPKRAQPYLLGSDMSHVINKTADSLLAAGYSKSDAPSGVLGDIASERARQDEKWGEQNHPNGTGPQSTPLRGIHYDGPVLPENGSTKFAFGLALLAKSSTDAKAEAGTVTFADILLEEVFEAMAESDPTQLRTELVQIAAVAAQWVEAIDRAEAAK